MDRFCLEAIFGPLGGLGLSQRDTGRMIHWARKPRR